MIHIKIFQNNYINEITIFQNIDTNIRVIFQIMIHI